MSKRNIIFVIILSAFLYFIHTSTLKAHDTGKVVVTYMDNTERLLHQLTINITDEIFRNLPAILDSISADIRQEIDKNINVQYKMIIKTRSVMIKYIIFLGVFTFICLWGLSKMAGL